MPIQINSNLYAASTNDIIADSTQINGGYMSIPLGEDFPTGMRAGTLAYKEGIFYQKDTEDKWLPINFGGSNNTDINEKIALHNIDANSHRDIRNLIKTNDEIYTKEIKIVNNAIKNINTAFSYKFGNTTITGEYITINSNEALTVNANNFLYNGYPVVTNNQIQNFITISNNNATQFGSATIAGSKAFKVVSQTINSVPNYAISINADKTGKIIVGVLGSNNIVEDITDNILIEQLNQLKSLIEQGNTIYYSLVVRAASYHQGTIQSVDVENRIITVNNPPTSGQFIEMNLVSNSDRNNAIRPDDPTNFNVWNNLIIEGYPELGTIDIGFNTLAAGINTHAANNCSVALGKNTKALGKFNLVGGESSIAGHRSIAWGGTAIALGAESAAFGYNIKANGTNSFAINSNNNAAGSNSCSTGSKTQALHDCSFTAGISTRSSAKNQFVIGTYNSDNSEALFIIGKGTSQKRENALEITKGLTVINTALQITGHINGALTQNGDFTRHGNLNQNGDFIHSGNSAIFKTPIVNIENQLNAGTIKTSDITLTGNLNSTSNGMFRNLIVSGMGMFNNSKGANSSFLAGEKCLGNMLYDISSLNPAIINATQGTVTLNITPNSTIPADMFKLKHLIVAKYTNNSGTTKWSEQWVKLEGDTNSASLTATFAVKTDYTIKAIYTTLGYIASIKINDVATSNLLPVKGQDWYRGFASGWYSLAAGHISTAMGYRNIAYGNNSAAIGRFNTVYGELSAAIGAYNNISHKKTIGIGFDLNSFASNQIILGQYNIASNNSVLIVGNGSEFNPSNAFTVNKDGTASIATEPTEINHVVNLGHLQNNYYTKDDIDQLLATLQQEIANILSKI